MSRRPLPLLVLCLFLLLTLAALALPAAPPPAATHPAIRCARDARGGLRSLDTAVSRFRGPLGVSVDLISAVHVATPAYYKMLNQQFKRYDAVLYELVADASAGRPIPTGNGESDNPLSMVQHGMSSMLGLDFQLDYINYGAPNFVHADVSPDELEKAMAKNHDSFMQILMRSLQNSGSTDPEAEKELSEVNLMTALTSGPSALDRAHMRRGMAILFSQPEKMSELLEGPGGGSLIGARNLKALSVLKKQVGAGRRHLGIFYGAAHMGDMERRLTQNGFRYASQTWNTAWDLRLPAGK